MKACLALMLVTALLGSAQNRRSEERITKFPVRGMHGAVAAGSEYSAEAGMRIFHQGGNAVDAGIATMFAASLAEISHFGLGGEAPILIRTKQGKVYAIAGVGTMPKMATAEFFRNHTMVPGEVMQLDPGGLKGMVPVAGILPALVPGMVDAGLLALREFGTKSFADVIEPAVELADAMPLDEMRAGTIAAAREFFELWPDSKRHFMPDGKVLGPGQILRRPDTAKTLRAMANAEAQALKAGKDRKQAIDAVRDYFYRGEIAKKIDAFSKANKGLLRYEDMASFHLEVEEPVSTTYRGFTVYKPGFWSQGPSMLQALNILEGFDMRSLGFNSADYIHKMAESLKLAYADRDTFYGDPKFSKIPMEALLSKEYAAKRRELISNTASMSFQPGRPDGLKGQHPSETAMVRIPIDDFLMAHDTTCVDTIDKEGIMFSATPSGAWLPAVIAGDTGIPLTQRAQSFLLIPGHPNELAGGKRPRVTLSPTLVTRGGEPFLVESTPGGDNQDQSLLQLLLNVVEFGMNAENAVEVPRFQTRHLISSFDNHAWNLGDLLLDERIPSSVNNELKLRGHKIEGRSRWNSGAAPVMVKMLAGGVVEAGSDPWGYRVAHAW